MHAADCGVQPCTVGHAAAGLRECGRRCRAYMVRDSAGHLRHLGGMCLSCHRVKPWSKRGKAASLLTTLRLGVVSSPQPACRPSICRWEYVNIRGGGQHLWLTGAVCVGTVLSCVWLLCCSGVHSATTASCARQNLMGGPLEGPCACRPARPAACVRRQIDAPWAVSSGDGPAGRCCNTRDGTQDWAVCMCACAEQG